MVHSSPKLGVNNVVKLLTFGNNYTGNSEICTLFLREKYRQGLNGRLMSKCRFLMMAEHPERFSKTIFAEMRGVSDANGNSPFWQWLQEHFFSIDFTLADYLTGIGKKGFIADLMPKLPIYINLLSPEAQAVIGQVHDNTRPALKLLEREDLPTVATSTSSMAVQRLSVTYAISNRYVIHSVLKSKSQRIPALKTS